MNQCITKEILHEASLWICIMLLCLLLTCAVANATDRAAHQNCLEKEIAIFNKYFASQDSLSLILQKFDGYLGNWDSDSSSFVCFLPNKARLKFCVECDSDHLQVILKCCKSPSEQYNPQNTGTRFADSVNYIAQFEDLLSLHIFELQKEGKIQPSVNVYNWAEDTVQSRISDEIR